MWQQIVECSNSAQIVVYYSLKARKIEEYGEL